MRFILKFLITLVNTQTLYKSCHKVSDILFHTKNLYTYNEQYVFIGISITCVPHSFQLPLKQKLFQLLFR